MYALALKDEHPFKLGLAHVNVSHLERVTSPVGFPAALAWHVQVTQEEALALAAALEHASEHPLAAAVLEHAEAVLLGTPQPADEDPVMADEGLDERDRLLGPGAVPAPSVGLRSPTARTQRRPRRTDWVRSVRDAEPFPGAQPLLPAACSCRNMGLPIIHHSS